MFTAHSSSQLAPVKQEAGHGVPRQHVTRVQPSHPDNIYTELVAVPVTAGTKEPFYLF